MHVSETGLRRFQIYNKLFWRLLYSTGKPAADKGNRYAVSANDESWPMQVRCSVQVCRVTNDWTTMIAWLTSLTCRASAAPPTATSPRHTRCKRVVLEFLFFSFCMEFWSLLSGDVVGLITNKFGP
mgnify:CR=1 FL=1